MKKIFENEIVITITMYAIILLITFGIIFITAKVDKSICEKNGGKYIWEWSYSSKCHLPSDK